MVYLRGDQKLSDTDRLDLEECFGCNFPIVDCRCHYRNCKAYESKQKVSDKKGNEFWEWDEDNCNCDEIEVRKQ